MIGIGRDHAANVKRWRDGKMALRWCAAGMIEAGKQFRRVNGHLHLPCPPCARMARGEWDGHPELESAFFEGYGPDPRDPAAWQRTLLREAIGTACWAYQVGDETFEQQGHRMIQMTLSSTDI